MPNEGANNYYIVFTGPTDWHRSTPEGWLELTHCKDEYSARNAARVILGNGGWEVYGSTLEGIGVQARAEDDTVPAKRSAGELGSIRATTAWHGYTPGPTGPYQDAMPGVVTCTRCRCLVGEYPQDLNVHRRRCPAGVE